MDDFEFRALLVLAASTKGLCDGKDNHVRALLDAEAANRGYCDWIDAFDLFVPFGY